MNCDQLTESLPGMFGPEGKGTGDAYAHLAGCPRCRAEYESYVHLIGSLLSFQTPESASLESALFRVGAEMSGNQDHPRPIPSLPRPSRPRVPRLFRPLSWHWTAQFVAAMLLGGLLGIGLTRDWRAQREMGAWGRLTRLHAEFLPQAEIEKSGIYNLGAGPLGKLIGDHQDVDQTRWTAHLGYVRLDDELKQIFSQIPHGHYYLSPELKEARISPLEIKEGLPFPEFLQRIAQSSNLIFLEGKQGKRYLFQTEGALFYQRGSIYYFVPKGDGIAPWYVDAVRGIVSYWPRS